eukprot:jgi/Botrbrau1/6611/Bobra.0189s0038.1
MLSKFWKLPKADRRLLHEPIGRRCSLRPFRAAYFACLRSKRRKFSPGRRIRCSGLAQEPMVETKGLTGNSLPVKLDGDTLLAGDRCFLSKLSRFAYTSPAPSPSPGLVIGLKAANGQHSSFENAALGSLKFTRFLACARIKMYWMTPEWGSSAAEVPPETQFLLLMLEGGAYVAMLPLLDSGKFRVTLRPATFPARCCSSSLL